MTTVTASRTDEVLAAMFTENTGRALLDSGDAYGRNWQRQQGKAVQDFIDAPEAYLNWGEYPVVDAFHWLRDRLEFLPDMQALYDEFVEGSNEPHLVDAENFADFLRGDVSASSTYLDGCVNTYNGDECLSQVLQFILVTPQWGDWEGETLCILQVHGGCDVRGGYTAPKVFRVMGYDAACMYDFDSYELYCTADRNADDALPGMPTPDPHYLTVRSGEIVEYGGSFCRDSDLWPDDDRIMEDEAGDKHIRCPYCADPTPMAVGKPYVS